MKYEETVLQREWETSKEQPCADVEKEIDETTPSDAALGALLEDAAPADADAERRVRRLGSRLARLDALNVAGMLAAATDCGGAGAALAERLEAAQAAGAALAQRHRRYDALARAAPAAPHARSDAARADANARRLLAELGDIYGWLDAPALRELDSLAEVALTSSEGRARALAAAEALRAALRAEAGAPAPRRRLAAVRERLRRLARARDQLAAALARHLNNALIHLGNEAAHEGRAHRHHAELLPYAPFMRWLKDMDEKAFDALVKVYVGTWARVHEREVRGACEAARAALAAAPPERAHEPLDAVLSLVESLCNAEQDFCVQFFFLDIDVKNEGGDGERSEKGEGGEMRGRAGAETRRFMAELFPALESELVALVGHVERHDPYGAMRALACVGRRVLGAVGARGAGGRGRGGQARRRPQRGRAPGRAARRRQAGGQEAEVWRAELRVGAGGAGRGVRAHLRRQRAARRPGALVRRAGRRHAARRAARRAPAHAARRAAHGELPPAARRAVGAARAGAGGAAARVPRALLGRAARLRHAVLRPPAREAHAVLRGRVRGGGAGRARGRGVLPRRLQQARAAPRARHVPRARSAQVSAPAVPHGGEAPERGGRPAAGGVARHAGGVHRAARGAAGTHRGVLPGGGADAASDHAAHPRRLLRHRARALKHTRAHTNQTHARTQTKHTHAHTKHTHTRTHTNHIHTHIYTSRCATDDGFSDYRKRRLSSSL